MSFATGHQCCALCTADSHVDLVFLAGDLADALDEFLRGVEILGATRAGETPPWNVVAGDHVLITGPAMDAGQLVAWLVRWKPR